MERRQFLGGAAAFCAAGLFAPRLLAQDAPAPVDPSATQDPLSAALPPEMQPTYVPMREGIPPYEIHVLPDIFRLYWTLPGNQAIRYAVRVGRAGLYEPGVYYVGAKKEWPSWTPTPDMVEREPEHYAQYAEDGMPGGPDNPLGARALYLFQEGRGDTFLRIHGTNDPSTIGRAVSNGCAGLINPHIIDLYKRVPLNTKVVLYRKTYNAT